MILLSPAKTLDYDSEIPPAFSALELTRPAYVKEAEELVARLRTLSASEVAQFMELSPALAQLNVERFAAWRPRCTPSNSRAAVLAFNGDVYEGLDARTLDAPTLDWAQQHLRILSGLYGLLRPLDRLQPYRLEMGRPLKTDRGGNLYAFWGDGLALALNKLGKGPLVNLASQEYFKAVSRKALKRPVVEPVFEEVKDGRAKVISFFAKRARGLMARFALQHRLTDPTDLQAFAEEGYRWQAQLSTPERWVFQRQTSV
ncbi:MAG: peroxide stress protein YaaA [Burkholderiales bacterium]